MLPAQRTWIVDNTAGPGYDFTDLVEAYTVISPGDTLHVRNSGVPYQMPYLMDKGARIIGLGPSRVPVVCTDPVVTVPTGQMLVIDGFELGSFGATDYPLFVQQSSGRILISNSYSTPTNRRPIWVYQSSPVIFADCTLDASYSCISAYSTVLLQNCHTHTYASGSSGGRGVEYAPIKAELGGLVWIIGGHHQGGDGSWYCDPWSGPIWYPAGPALNTDDGRAIIVGPAILEGGWVPASPCPNGGGGPWQGQYGIWNDCTPGYNDVVFDPLMQARISATCFPFGTVTAHEFPAVIPGPATRNQPQTFDLYGPTQSIVALFASFAHPYDPIVLPVGDVWLDPTLVVCVGVAPVDAQRHASMQTRIPGWLAIGDVLVYQAVSLSQQSTFEISPPGFSVIH